MLPSAAIRTPSRRDVLRGMQGIGLAALVGVAAGPAARADTRGTPDLDRFDLTARAFPLYTGAKLASVTVQQSFAFDVVNGKLFVAQLLTGSPGVNGDLHISELTSEGVLRGAMILRGFGHGVSIAAQPVGTTTYLWTETDANANGYGAQLARFVWRDGADYTPDSPEVTRFLPVPEALETTCAIDPFSDSLLVRYHTALGKRLAWFRLSDMTAFAESGGSGPVPVRRADFAQPPGFGTFQGYAVCGNFMYALDGNAYSDSNPDPGNAHLSSIDLRTGDLIERTLTTAGRSLVFREPEGMAIGRSPGGQPQLFFGFATGVGGDRRSNLFYIKRSD